MNILEKFNYYFTKGIRVLLCVLMVFLVIVVFSNAVSRYFLDISIPWADEASRFMFIWVSFLGAILAFKSKEHMRFNLVVNLIPKRLSSLVKAIANLITLGILVILINGGITLVTQNMDWYTPALEIPYGVVYFIVPVSCIVLAVLAVSAIGGNIKNIKGGKK